jgi:agmatinase
MHPIDELALLLRPAGGGLYLLSTGRAEQEAAQRALYGAGDAAGVEAAFRRNLDRIERAQVFIAAIPSDVGAGFVRGANLGPQAIRAELLRDAHWTAWCDERGIVDIGDVFVVPQFLHDSMLNEAQIAKAREALYPNTGEPLPVSPLSIAERAFDLIYALNPRIKPFTIGGDHSCAWPAVSSLHKVRPDFAIVQSDAHTDLLEARLGVDYCFATWSYHANQLLGRGGKLVQLGIRATRFPKEHWEDTLGVKQFWADECRRDPEGSIERIVAHCRSLNVNGVYFSNDIDGIDSAYADATGTPEPDGLEPELLFKLIDQLGQEVGISGGDMMEVAPLAQRTPDGGARTVELATRYVRATLDAMTRLGRSGNPCARGNMVISL